MSIDLSAASLPFHWIKGACTSFLFPSINTGFFFAIEQYRWSDLYDSFIHSFIYLGLVHFWTDVWDWAHIHGDILDHIWKLKKYIRIQRSSKQHYHKMKAQPKQRSHLDFSAYGVVDFFFGMHNRKNSCGWET